MNFNVEIMLHFKLYTYYGTNNSYKTGLLKTKVKAITRSNPEKVLRLILSHPFL